MRTLARFVGFIALAMASDVIGGVIGWMLAGNAGAAYGDRMADRLCFGFVAALVTVHGWQALTAPFLVSPKQPGPK